MSIFPFSGDLLNPGIVRADNMRMKGLGWGRSLIALALVSAMALASGTAGATDIEELRDRARSLGSQVTDLEQRLARLSAQESELRQSVARTSAAIGVLELQKHELDAAYDAARTRFIARAVEAYKAGPTANIELLLGAKTMSQMLTVAEAGMRAADQDAHTLEMIEEAQLYAQQKQDEIDERQQKLVQTHASVNAVVSETEQTVAARRAVLDEIVAQINEIEEQARLAAAASARPTAALLRLLAPSGPAPEVPDGFAATGVSFEGIASWYGPGFEGNHTASGDVFDPDLYTAASRDLPLGTWLFVTHGSRGVVVLVNDRGPYIDDRVLDLSRAAAEAIGISGLGWIEAELLIKA